MLVFQNSSLLVHRGHSRKKIFRMIIFFSTIKLNLKCYAINDDWKIPCYYSLVVVKYHFPKRVKFLRSASVPALHIQLSVIRSIFRYLVEQKSLWLYLCETEETTFKSLNRFFVWITFAREMRIFENSRTLLTYTKIACIVLMFGHKYSNKTFVYYDCLFWFCDS